ncbi:MAG: ABC transporter substrate-binding protein [Hyphomicrobiales bacterium]|nr:MAG: ABC transporter substrate-binding protein [Hyphomicrobiales bacterium]
MNKIAGTLAMLSILVSSTSAYAIECNNTVWNKIQANGKIVVGVKADTKPWGYRSSDGKLIGMEIDLAQEVADTLGVELELVAVQSSNRMQFLEVGKIDLMIATMSDRLDRRKIVGVVGPNYYSSGTNIMAPKALKITSWNDLNGKPVCGKQGTFYNKIIEERYGADVIAFGGNAEAKQALRDKKCIAWVYDDSVIAGDLLSGNFDDYEMPLASEDDNPWGIAVPIEERNCVFGRFISGMQFNWHQTGDLIKLEEKWGIQSTAYLATQKDQFADWLSE